MGVRIEPGAHIVVLAGLTPGSPITDSCFHCTDRRRNKSAASTPSTFAMQSTTSTLVPWMPDIGMVDFRVMHDRYGNIAAIKTEACYRGGAI